MDSSPNCTLGVAIDIRSHREGVRDAIRRHPRCIWTVCAATSILTSRHLYRSASLNYPVQIHLLQLITVAIYLAWTSIRHQQRKRSTLLQANKTSWTFLIILGSVMSLSVGFTLQAVLHMPNTTTLVMLTTISCLMEHLVCLCRSPSTRSKSYIWLLPFAIGCCGILLGEYRLAVKGLESGILAALLTGISRILYSSVADALTELESDRRRFDMLFCGSGIVITSLWLFFIKDTWMMMLESFQCRYAPLLAVNIGSTAVAMVLGKSTLLPMIVLEPRATSGDRNELRARDTVTILLLTGITGLVSTLTIHRSYTTYVQIWAFLVAICCFGGSSSMETICRKLPATSWGYTKVEPPIDLERVSSEISNTSEDTNWSNETRVEPPLAHRTRSLTYSVAIALIIAISWITFLLVNFQESTLPQIAPIKPILDRTYQPAIPIEIVISMYKERISDVHDMISTLRDIPALSSAIVSIYTKDGDANTENIKRLTNADYVTILPNIGREGETYLYHILTQWDSLAHQTFFLQADVHNPREFYPRIRNYFIPERTGMLNLGWSGEICDCHSCTDHWRFNDHTHLFPTIHQQINNATECDEVLLSYKGQFVVSAARIRGIRQTIYHDLREAFVNESSWAHQPEFTRGKVDTMSQPVFGYAMERIWNLLFQCSSGDVAWKCPSLVSGWRIGGSKADCQCFDE